MEKANKCSDGGQDAQQQNKIDIETALESMQKYRKIIHAGIARWVKDFQDGRIEIKTVDDLKKLIEIDAFLQKDEIYLRKIYSRQQREGKGYAPGLNI